MQSRWKPWRAASLRRCGGVALGILIVAGASGPLHADEEDDANLRSFVAGDYALVGRIPDLGAAYAGAATITQDGTQLILDRRIGGRTLRAIGRVEAPSPGEGRVLRFRWTDAGAMTMTCLVGGDLDNHARLTCLWGADEPSPERPGLEAMFPTAAWPQGPASP